VVLHGLADVATAKCRVARRFAHHPVWWIQPGLRVGAVLAYVVYLVILLFFGPSTGVICESLAKNTILNVRIGVSAAYSFVEG